MRDVDPHCRIGMVHIKGYPGQRPEDRLTWVVSMPPRLIGDNKWLGYVITRGRWP